MFHATSSFLRSAREISGQFPEALGSMSEEQNQPIALAWDVLPNIQTAVYCLPNEVTHHIFMRLPTDQLFTVRRVCKLWHGIASRFLSLPRLFPEARVIGRDLWERHIDLQQHGLVFEEGKEPRPTKRDYVEVRRMASEVERGQGITILTLPKGLTLNKIIAFAAAPKVGNSTLFRYVDPDVLRLYGDQSLEETVTVVVTNGVFYRSRDINVAGQEALVKSLKCDMPELMPFMANMILSFISSDPQEVLPFLGDDMTYTRCRGKVGNYTVIGGFILDGPYPGPYVDSYDFPHENFGVAGLRKFP